MDMLACMDNTINSATAVVKALGGTQEKNISNCGHLFGAFL